jgi:hypothetical protein
MPLCAAAVEALLEMRAERRENIAIQMDGASLLSTEAHRLKILPFLDYAFNWEP